MELAWTNWRGFPNGSAPDEMRNEIVDNIPAATVIMDVV